MRVLGPNSFHTTIQCVSLSASTTKKQSNTSAVLQVCVELSTAAVNVTLLACAADRRAAIKRYRLLEERPAANPPQQRANNDTDGRPTVTQTLPHTMRAASTVKKVKFSHTRYRALGPDLIPVYRQSARR